METSSINGLSSIRMDFGVMYAKNDEYELKFKGLDKSKTEMKKGFDSQIEQLEERLDNLRIRLEQDKTKNANSEQPKNSNVSNFLAGKMDDIFSSNRFKKLENLEPLLTDKIKELESQLNEFVRYPEFEKYKSTIFDRIAQVNELVQIHEDDITKKVDID